jgi:SAM-dependent methyltransferase
VCGRSILSFVAHELASERIAQRRVLEVGSCDVNGSPRRVLEPHGPSLYLGIDLRHGPGVDLVLDVVDAPARLGEASFDVVICTEVLEHIRDWRAALDAMKRTLRPDGVLLVTTRSPGFPLHDFPSDYWRFTLDDLRGAFADLDDVVVEPDPNAPGVFGVGVRPGRITNAVDLRAIHPQGVSSPAADTPAQGVADQDLATMRRGRVGKAAHDIERLARAFTSREERDWLREDLRAAENTAWGFDERFRVETTAGPLQRRAFALRNRRLRRRAAQRSATIGAWFPPAAALQSPPRAEPDTVDQPPTFVGIGTSKSGTTWWYELLAAHPRWAKRPTGGHSKELLYFDQFLTRPFTAADARRYRTHFRRRTDELLGEWTPIYVDSPWIAPMLYEAVPDAQLLILVRDPVERAISDLRFQFPRYGHDFNTLDVLEAARRSSYATLLQPWLTVFPHQQVHVLQYERCRIDPMGELSRTWQALGVDDPCPPDELAMAGDHVFHPATIIVPDTTRARLTEMLSPDATRFQTAFADDIDESLWPTLTAPR